MEIEGKTLGLVHEKQRVIFPLVPFPEIEIQHSTMHIPFSTNHILNLCRMPKFKGSCDVNREWKWHDICGWQT